MKVFSACGQRGFPPHDFSRGHLAAIQGENTASIALLERLGLRRDGHFIQNVWFKGKWADEYLYAILQHEWLGKHSKSVEGR